MGLCILFMGDKEKTSRGVSRAKKTRPCQKIRKGFLYFFELVSIESSQLSYSSLVSSSLDSD
jgi:hypothetical protein